MDITAEEVESVKIAGSLFGDEVKMLKTLGGFYMAVGKKKRGRGKVEALAAGSHQALVSHQLTKEYGSDFQPALAKSEHDRLPDVSNKTEYLPSDAIEKGIELYELTKGSESEIILYKHGLTLGQYKMDTEGDALILKSYGFNKEWVKSDQKIAKAISRAMSDRMHDLGLSKVKGIE